MKPAFALDFRDDSIGLLHRSGSVWQVVGTVPLDAPDLTEALNYLRSTAVGLSPRALATKLIIPNDQILYTPVAVSATDQKARRAEVAAALEGRTPYDVADLQFDYHGDGPEVMVAVIAKETLAEAEAFAVEHRFNPVSFVAVPEDDRFGGEAWFGPSAYSAELLQPGESVKRDGQAVVTQARTLVQAKPMPEGKAEKPPASDRPASDETVRDETVAEPIAAPAVEPVAPPAAPVEDTAEQSSPPVSVVEQSVVEQTAIEDDIAAEPEADAPAPASPAVLPELDLSIPAVAPPVAAASIPPVGVEKVAFPEDLDEPEDNRALAKALGETLARPLPPQAPASAFVAPSRPTLSPEPEAAEAPMALDVQADDVVDEEPQGASAIAAALTAQGGQTSARVIDPHIEDEIPEAPTGSGFASRRQAPQPGAAPSIGAAARSLQRPPAAKSNAAPKAGRPADTRSAAADASGLAKSGLRGLTDLVKSRSKSNKADTLAGVAAAVAAPAIAASVPVTQPASAAAARSKVATKRTDLNRGPGGFGTLRSAPPRGKPRYLGLFLTALLLFLLAMVAAWSSYSLGAWNTTDEATVQTAAADPASPDISDAAPDATDEMLADMQDPAAMTQGDDAALTAEEIAALDLAAADLPPAAAPKTEVASEPVFAANPTSGTQDEIFLAANDLPPAAPDPLSLQQPEARGDPLPAAQAAPPPFGTVYQFTADGLIRPTPEGIITPEGVLLLAGKPKVIPPLRPDTVTELAIASKSAGPTPEAAAVAAVELVPASPTMIGAKPKPRPDGLVPAAPADQGSLAPAAGSRFASLRPQPRPAVVLSAGDQAQQASAAATLSSQPAAIDTAVAEAAAQTSPLAISISRKPAARPKDMSRAVEAAIAATVRTPEPTKRAAAAAPEDDGEPELPSAAPKIPTKATVAKQATFANVLNMSEINLIGIYGTQNNRYALVRQPNGRYKKMRVGDSIDNGKIVAITASELRYQKRGKLLALAMPKT